MMVNFAKRLNDLEPHRSMKKWDHEANHIQYVLLSLYCSSNLSFCTSRCLAHVINLTTQAVIVTYSQAKHYDPANPDGHEPDTLTSLRGEIGLVRSITVKVGECGYPLYIIMMHLYSCNHLQNAKKFSRRSKSRITNDRSLCFLIWLFGGHQPSSCCSMQNY